MTTDIHATIARNAAGKGTETAANAANAANAAAGRLRGLPTPRFSTIQPCTCCGAGEGNR